MLNIRQLVSDAGLTLPQAPGPVGNYQATISTDNLLFISGQLPLSNGELIYTGALGQDLTAEEGKSAAELCALNLLSQLDQALEDRALEDRALKSIVKVEGYINACESFTEHAAVLNGASDLLFNVLGDKAGHIRTVIGCSSLPMNAAVEVSIIAELA